MKDTFPVPRRYKGEGTILRIFTKKSIVYTVIGGLVGYGLFGLLNFLGFLFVGLAIWMILLLAFFGFGSLKIPSDTFNSGGDDLDKIVYRWFKKRKKILYIDSKNMLEPVLEAEKK